MEIRLQDLFYSFGVNSREEEAAGSASRGELASSAMAELESEQPSFTIQSESEDTEKDCSCEDSKVCVSIEG